MSDNPAEDPAARRVAVHELGHGSTFYLIYKQAEAVFVYQVDGEWRGQQPPPADLPLGRDPTTRAEWRDVIAWTYGGWAAVHLAIGRGELPDIEEERPGDIGFLGPFPEDEGCVKKWAVQSGEEDPDGLIEDGRRRALELIEPHLIKLLALVPLMIGGGYAGGDDIAKACGGLESEETVEETE